MAAVEARQPKHRLPSGPREGGLAVAFRRVDAGDHGRDGAVHLDDDPRVERVRRKQGDNARNGAGHGAQGHARDRASHDAPLFRGGAGKSSRERLAPRRRRGADRVVARQRP